MKFLAFQKTSDLPRLLWGKSMMIALFVLVNMLCTLSLPAQKTQNNTKVKGHITSDKGQALTGATVSVKGASGGVNTDINGNFELTAPSNGTLLISYVGFAQQEIKINGRTTIDISLSSYEQSMEQVFVVGYGTQRKKDVTGSVVSVSGSTLQEVPTANLISELKGRAAGVDIVSNSATPGGAGQIRIRGNRSMSQTQGGSDGLDQPLVVLDGIP